jgi:ArsR family transcriptional regulator
MIKPDSLFGILSDSTRFRALMLIQAEGEVCVCELTFALDESQPKISRHLALMREAGIVESRREGTWMHYRINSSLPDWSKETLKHVHGKLFELSPYRDDMKQLKRMNNRPERACA